MILLSVQNLVKHFGPEPVLAGVTLDIRPGERVSLVGPNGAGKTTLMRIITGSEQADSGQVDLHLSATLGYLEQQPEFEAGRTVWDEARSALAAIADLAQHSEDLAHAIAAESEEAERKRLEHRLKSAVPGGLIQSELVIAARGAVRAALRIVGEAMV